MIGFNGLGKHGRLGNQMFQYAALKGISAKHNYDWCIPPSEFNNADYDHQLLKIFNLYSLQNIQYVPNNYPLVAEEGFYLSGGYCKLNMALSEKIDQEAISNGNCFDVKWLKQQDNLGTKQALKLSAGDTLATILDFVTPTGATFPA